MKAKKLGRPPVKDKKIAYTFTTLASIKKEKLKKVSKNDIDIELRKTLNNI